MSVALKKLSANAYGGINVPPNTMAGRDTCGLSLFPPGQFWQYIFRRVISDNIVGQRVIFVKKSLPGYPYHGTHRSV
jgi:hypothetical protein